MCRCLLLHLIPDHTHVIHIHSFKTLLHDGSARRRFLCVYNTYHSQETNIHAPGGIRTRNPSKRAATGIRVCLRPHGYRDRLWLRIPWRIVLKIQAFRNVAQNLWVDGSETSEKNMVPSPSTQKQLFPGLFSKSGKPFTQRHSDSPRKCTSAPTCVYAFMPCCLHSFAGYPVTGTERGSRTKTSRQTQLYIPYRQCSTQIR
jgi:hypothetical protein